MASFIRAYVVELRDGTEVRFDDGAEAYEYVKTLEPGTWARLYGDVNRDAEKAYYAGQAKKVK